MERRKNGIGEAGAFCLFGRGPTCAAVCSAKTVPPMSLPASDPLSGRIFTIRGQRVVFDADLARLYGTTTMAFNQAVRRNRKRFPPDFIIEVSHAEHAHLISQTVISNPGTQGGRRKPALAFTEHGAIMAATILRSPKAVVMSVYVVRAFVRMREELMTSAVIMKRLSEIDKKLVTHDVILRDIYEKLRPLLTPPPEPLRKELGFHTRMKKP